MRKAQCPSSGLGTRLARARGSLTLRKSYLSRKSLGRVHVTKSPEVVGCPTGATGPQLTHQRGRDTVHPERP